MVYDPVSQTAAAAYGADQAFSGNSMDPRRAQQNDWYRLRDELLNKYQDIDPDLRNYLTVGGSPSNMDPGQLLNRYESINQGPEELRNLVNGIWGWNPNDFAQDSTNQYAYDTFRSVFGRGPSQTEFSQILPIFGGAEGRQRGAAAVSQMFDAYKQSPEYLKTQAGNYGSQLDPIFDQLLGRDYSNSELDYYGQQLAGGRSMFEIEQALKGSQEYQQAEDKKFRTGLASELEGYDTSFFNKAQENVISRAAKNNGGFGTSSALDFALTNLMGEIAEKRGSYLANISAQQYGGNKDAARADYLSGRDRYFADLDYTRRRNDADSDYYRSRSDDDRDYTRQLNDYYAQMGRANQGKNTLHTGDWINLGINGANAGANIYGASQMGNNRYSWLDY